VKGFLKFFVSGPGAILSVIAFGLSVCWIVNTGREKQEAEQRKHQIERPLGKINPSDDIDQTKAQKETLLSDKSVVPAKKGEQTQPASNSVSFTQAKQSGNATALPQLVSFYTQVLPTPTPTPTPPPPRPKPVEIWLPRGTFVACALVNTVESSHINTPVVGEVIRDVYENGHLIIPAGSLATCWAQPGAVRDRIEVAGKWSLTYPDGKEFELQGVACDREADPSNQQFGIEDGSAGLQGKIIESDHWATAKAFIALLLTTANQAGTAIATSALQASHTTGVVGLPDTTPIMGKYLDQLLNGETGDGTFVRVRSSKEFYIFTASVVEPTKRSVGGRRQQEEEQQKQQEQQQEQNDSDKALEEALRTERKIQEAAQPGNKNEKEQLPRFKY
jgi:Bacterial conjugation TrbI-like protein